MSEDRDVEFTAPVATGGIVVADDTDVVEVISRAIDQVDWQDPLVQARAALTALREAGYTVSRALLTGDNHER